MDALLRASLQVDAVSLTIVDPYLTPFLDRLLAELSLEFFRIGQHLFGIEIRKATALGTNAVVEFLESRIQRTVPVIHFQLSEPQEGRLATLESALNVSYFMATAGQSLLIRAGDEGKLALTAWIDEIARSVALTQSQFLAGFFRLGRLDLQDDLKSSAFERLRTTAKWLEQEATPLSADVDSGEWEKARRMLRSNPRFDSQAVIFMDQVIPLLDAGAAAPFNTNFIKNSVIRYLRQE